MHTDPEKLRSLIPTEAAVEEASARASLHPRLVIEAWRGERRLTDELTRRLAEALGRRAEDLSCHHRRYVKGAQHLRCGACGALNVIPDELVAPVAELVSRYLTATQDALRSSTQAFLRPTPQSWAASAAELTQGEEFAVAAEAVRRLGGDLTSEHVADTGVAALLGGRESFDVDRVGWDLARYAAGGDTEKLQLVGLNVCGRPDGPVPLGKWELVRLGEHGVRELMPVPDAAHLMPRPGWDFTAAAATWWLRRSIGIRPRRGPTTLEFWFGALHEIAPAPLLVLALADNAPVRPLSYFSVQRGIDARRIAGEELSYEWLPHGPENDDYQPVFFDQQQYSHMGGHRRKERWPAWIRFCDVVSPMVERVFERSARGEDQAASMFARSAEHYIGAVVDAATDTEPRQRTLLEFSIALEALLVAGDSDLSLQFRNAAAWLGGRDDRERERVWKLAKRTYAAGSAYRHGGKLFRLYRADDAGSAALREQKRALDMEACRAMTRQLLLHAVAVLDAGIDQTAAEICSQAQYQTQPAGVITEVLTQLYERLEQQTPLDEFPREGR